MLGKVTAIARSGSAGLIRRAGGAPRVRISGPRAISCGARKAAPSISFFLDQALVSGWPADEEGQRVLQPLESAIVKGAMAEESDTRARKRAKTNPNVNEKRRLVLKEGRGNDGPVIYWMSRDQRMQDNWALLWACEKASNRGQAVAVAFTLVEEYMLYGARQFGFMLRGLRELPAKLKERGIEFFLLRGAPEEEVPKLCSKAGASLLVMDFLPLRQSRLWREAVAEKVECGVDLVDAHNIVPVWQASDKQEYAARTIRGKLHRKLPEFLTEFPEVPSMAAKWSAEVQPAEVDWDKVLQQAVSRDTSVPEVSWLTPGEDGARAALADFVSTRRLKMYSDKRNDPNHPQALSNLSPYLHFGQLSAQRAAIEAAQRRKNHKEAVESFLEELVVRRELSDNFCHYQEQYDSLGCAAGWAKETLDAHRGDEREHLYTRDQLEQAKTHDELWNAAQKEMVHQGKMHGFMRMYWAKKILEWTESPDQALAIAIYLNDKYELDGCDPNGYVGVAWSICGIHDQGWKERAVFGKIRYMNFAGCKRKFDVQGYISRVNRQVKAGGGKVTPWTK